MSSDLFEPLVNTIRDQLIPTLIGQEVSDAVKQILALPLKAWWARSDKSSGNCQDRIEVNSDHAKLTDQIYKQKLILNTTPQTRNIPET